MRCNKWEFKIQIIIFTNYRVFRERRLILIQNFGKDDDDQLIHYMTHKPHKKANSHVNLLLKEGWICKMLQKVNE